MSLRFAAVCGLAVPFVFTASLVFGGLAQPDAFSSANDDISDLGAQTASSAWIYNQVGANLTGLLLVCFALGLWRAVGRNLLARLGVAALVIVGTGVFIDGFLRLDCQGIDTGCTNASWHSDAHRLESGVTATMLLVAPLLLAFAFRRIPEWRALWVPTLCAVPASIVAAIAASAFGDGASSRASTVTLLVWIALLGLWLYRLSPVSRETG